MNLVTGPKLIAFLKRKNGMTIQQFKVYYEERHVPLILRLIPHMADYRRNYIGAASSQDLGSGQSDYDVVTEVWFATASQFQAFLEIAQRPDVQAEIAKDEENFLDRGATRMLVVEECGGAIPA